MTSLNPFFGNLKFKLWVRRLSVSAPRMTIKSRLPWPLRLVYVAVALGLGGAIAMWTFDLGRSFTGFIPGASREQLAGFKEQLDKITAERDQFSTTVNAAESQLNIERSAQRQMAAQVKTLETENIRLKEDLAFFESLLPADTGAQGVSIRRLKAEIVAPNQLRYRLLVMQGGKGDRDFVGNLQLTVTVLQGGNSAMMVFPDANSGQADKFKLSFKHYQRVEGVLMLPEGVSMKAVQARIMDKGQVRAQQSANL
jgi:hypothetical protein